MESDNVNMDMVFVSFVSMLASSAMQAMGKIINPMTGKIEKDLASAKATIDIIDMLKRKTAGNLSKKEEEIVNNTLSTLQLNYVDESNQGTDMTPSSEDASDGDGESRIHIP